MSVLIHPGTGQPFARTPDVSPETEARLQSLERRWFIRLVPAMPPYWGLFEKWRYEDVRRENIRTGEYPSNADHDMLGQFPGHLSADEVVSLIESKMERAPQTKQEQEQQAEDRVNATEAHNAAVKEQRKQEFVEDQNYVGSRRSAHERRLVVGDGTANAMSTTDRPKHSPPKKSHKKKATKIPAKNPNKGKDPDERDPMAALDKGDFPKVGDVNYTQHHHDASGMPAIPPGKSVTIVHQ